MGEENDLREQLLNERMNISPTVEWSETGNIQLNHEVSVTVTLKTDLGFGELGSFPVTLTAKATGKSEVYWK